MFGTANAIEPVEIARSKPAVRAKEEEPPVREATRADALAAAKRRETETKAVAADSVRAVPAPKAGFFGRRQAEPAQPDAVSQRHGLYVTEKRGTRTYFADYQQKQEVMRADTKRISTKQDDRQTVGAMLDLAQERGWTRVRVRGTEDFKRETWVQAQVRGIAAEGYKPSATDEQEVARRKAGLSPVDGQGERAGASGREAVAIGSAASGGEVPDRVTSKAAETAVPAETAAPKQAVTPAPEQAPTVVRAARAIPAEAVAKAARDASQTPAARDADPAAKKTGPVVLSAAGQAAAARAQARAAERAAGLEGGGLVASDRPRDSFAAHDAKLAAMTPEQREAFSRVVHGSLHSPRVAEVATMGGEAAQARAKAVWGNIEDAGRVLREKAASSAVAEKGAERAGERKAAAQRA